MKNSASRENSDCRAWWISAQISELKYKIEYTFEAIYKEIDSTYILK